MSFMATRFITCPICAVFGPQSEDPGAHQPRIEFNEKKINLSLKRKKINRRRWGTNEEKSIVGNKASSF